MAVAALGSPRLHSGDEICSVLRHIRVASKHELKERVIAGIEDVDRHHRPHLVLQARPRLPDMALTSKTMV